ncbi:hypothetical protein B2J95_24785 [Enterobacter cloacae]|nr:hypothetical protein B2J95_24785 [Enterobacter cloacae]OZU91762.1 hypothetical protein CIW67_17020 [Enterobacter cloacae]PAN67178.1 hypothetical protein CIW70_21760 [Enterobacter cloacae]PAN81303.1 hypothetical protein CIW65_20730 [Enterobacter cloacae]PAN81411.1 hypothetical protein CIW66_19145 [Enterobacter cloacae]
MHVTCQRYTKKFYIAQHFKIKGISAAKTRLTHHKISVKAQKCRQKETVKTLMKYYFSFQLIKCRWFATTGNAYVGEWIQR